MSKLKDLSNQRFGKLKVIEHYGSNKNGRALWLCQCDCGNVKVILGNKLTQGLVNSCGCYNKEI